MSLLTLVLQALYWAGEEMGLPCETVHLPQLRYSGCSSGIQEIRVELPARYVSFMHPNAITTNSSPLPIQEDFQASRTRSGSNEPQISI